MCVYTTTIYILLAVVLLLLLLFKRLPLFGLDIFWVPKYSYTLLSLSRDKLFYLLSQKKKKKYRQIKCSFGTKLKSHFILLFNLFLLLFMSLTALFYTIHKSHCTCKDQNWLESRTGMDPGPRSPNDKFIECRRES